MRLILLATCLVLAVQAENWPGWRGPRGDGTSSESALAIRWNDTENIAWKTRVPGTGHSSPIIWNDQVFLTTAREAEQERILLALDRQSGAIQWQRTVLRCPPETIHRLNSRASGTPATDGERIYVAFLRPEGKLVIAPNVSNERLITPGRVIMAAYSLDGREIWRKDLGPFVSAHGFNSCPVLFQELVILNGDHDGDSYLVALDCKTGDERWRVPREHRTRSYVTPLIRTIAGRTQMVLSGSHRVTSYDPLTGQIHWKTDGPTEQFIASMVFNGDLFFVTGGYPERHILAIQPDGHGNVTDSHIRWRTKRGAAYVPSPILSGDYLLVVADSGIASCFDAASGERHWMERLPGGHSASPVTAEGRVYFTSDLGITSVVEAGKEFNVLAQNEIGERVSASVAVSHGQIFLRSHRHLFCIAPTKP